MPVEISVGPSTLTINQGSAFVVTDLNGEVTVEQKSWQPWVLEGRPG